VSVPSVKRIAFGVLVLAVLAAAVLNVLVWQGHFVDDEGSAAPSPRTASREPPPPPPPPPPPAITRRTPVAPPPRPAVSTIVLTASRGDCWVVARDTSPTGPVLYEGLLQQGSSTRLKAKRLWLSLGAAANLDVVIDGKPEELPGGTVEVVVPSGSNS
jgi:Domain of unknown function (DUF4115)